MAINQIFIFIIVLIFLNSSYADLVALEDNDLGNVDGEGIGLILEDFLYNAGESVNSGGTFEISGLKTSNDEDVVIAVSQFYIAGSGSNNGSILNAVNLGRLNNPFNLSLIHI